MVQIGRYTGPKRGLSQVGADYFSGADTKGGALLQGIGNAILSGGGEAIDILRDVYGAGNLATDLLGKIPGPEDVLSSALGSTYNYLTSPSASALKKLQSVDELRTEEDKGLIDSSPLTQQLKSLGEIGEAPEDKGLPSDEFIDPPKKDTETSAGAGGAGADTTDIDTRSKISDEQVLREGEDEQTGVEDAPKKDDQSDAFTEAMKSLEDAASGEVSKVKGLDYYKKQFADATGIDISGKPDTRAATIAFGLALMQNKAGKKFNVGKMLSSIGEAGEKALPLAESARKEARAAQISAGTFALQERKAAITSQIAQQQKKIDSVLAIEKEFRGYANKKELERIKAATKITVENLKQQRESIEKAKDRKNDLLKDGFKLTGLTQKIPVSTQKELKVSVASKEINGQMVFPYAETEASQFATGLGQLEKATSTLDQIESNLQKIIEPDGSVTLSKAKDVASNILSALGSQYSLYKDEEGKPIPGELTENKILQDRLVSQYKRFLTQETGNGISTKDLEMVKELIGQVGFFTNPTAALTRIREVRDIFDTPKQQILTQLEQFSDPKKHLTDDAYNNTMKIINEAALGASMLGGQMSFDLGEYNRDDEGNILIDLTQLAG